MCKGYRNEIDFLFRDQNEAVAIRVHGPVIKASSGGSSSPPVDTPDSSKEVSRGTSPTRSSQSWQSPPPCLQRPQSASAYDQAACFFFSRYGTRQSSLQPKTLYEHLPGLYCVETGNELVKCIVTAIGLAGLSQRKHDPGMLLAADTSYNLALRQTNNALRDSTTASADETLIGILLLGLYEASIPLPSPCTLISSHRRANNKTDHRRQ